MRAGAVSLAVFALLAAAPSGTALGAADPADQPPFGGEPVPPLVDPGGVDAQPEGFSLSVHDALDRANATAQARAFFGGVGESGEVDVSIATRGSDRWEVRYRLDGEVRALVIVDDASGEVVEAWTGSQVETKLARGYEDAVSGDLNEWWLWLPLCLLFFAPFFDPRRPFRLLHLDLLALLGFSASLFFFNKGEIGVSAPLVYPVLAYLLVRMLIVGFKPDERPRADREPLLRWARPNWLLAGVALLACFHVYYAVDQAKVIDVGVAGVVGADRLLDGEDIYSEDFSSELPESGDVRGDVYGPVNYLAYVPAEQAFPWEDEWDDVPAARYSALAFDLLTALALFLLGRRLRRGGGDRGDGEGGDALGVALAFAWLAYPFTLYTLGSSFNDSLVALGVVGCLLVLSSPPGRGAVAALSGLTKFGTLGAGAAVRRGDRRAATADPARVRRGLRGGRSRGHGPGAARRRARASCMTARSATRPRAGRRSASGARRRRWSPLQTLSKVFAVGLAVAVFFVPRTPNAGPGRGARGRGADRGPGDRQPLVLSLRGLVRAARACSGFRRLLDTRARQVRTPVQADSSLPGVENSALQRSTGKREAGGEWKR